MNLNKLMEKALNEAKKSTHHYQLGAIIFRQGKVISKGHNKTNRGVSNIRGYWSGSLHAEISALISARCRLDGASIFVARHNRRGARPCISCLVALKQAGIKRVFYTNNGFIEEEKVQ